MDRPGAAGVAAAAGAHPGAAGCVQPDARRSGCSGRAGGECPAWSRAGGGTAVGAGGSLHHARGGGGGRCAGGDAAGGGRLSRGRRALGPAAGVAPVAGGTGQFGRRHAAGDAPAQADHRPHPRRSARRRPPRTRPAEKAARRPDRHRGRQEQLRVGAARQPRRRRRSYQRRRPRQRSRTRHRRAARHHAAPHRRPARLGPHAQGSRRHHRRGPW